MSRWRSVLIHLVAFAMMSAVVVVSVRRIRGVRAPWDLPLEIAAGVLCAALLFLLYLWDRPAGGPQR